MTICISTICDSSKKVIVASDRMMTSGDLTVAFEHDVPKIQKLTENCVALTAGSALVHTDLFRNVRASIHAGATPPISEIVDKVKKEYLEIRNRQVEEKYFKVRGYDIEWFNQNQHRLNPEIVLRLDHELETYRFNLQILVAGVDTNGAHVYCIYPPCCSECFEALGYCNIGTGERHADSTFIAYRYTPSFPLKTALNVTFEAKKKAEIAVGVGKSTDMAIISDKGVLPLEKEAIEKLEEIYLKGFEIATLKNEEINKLIAAIPLAGGAVS